jgi:hypothetical protein
MQYLNLIIEKLYKKELLIWTIASLFIAYGFVGYKLLNVEGEREVVLQNIPRENVVVHNIKRINVLAENKFDIILDNDQRISAKLPLEISPEAKERIIFLLNNSINPKVNMIEKQNKMWVIDIELEKDQKKFFLTEWLVARNFVYTEKLN